MKQTTDVGLDLGKWLGGAAAGALLMYMLDPDRGGARRAQTTGKLRDASRQSGSMLGSAMHSLGSRITGAAASAADSIADSASRFAASARPDGAAGSIEESAARVGERAKDALSHTMARASDAASEAGGRARQALQGGRGDWSSALRNPAVIGGGLLGLYGLVRRSPLSLMLGLAGAALVARNAPHLSIPGLLRGRSLEQAIDLEKTIQIDASPEEVYDLWANFENFPRFMSHVVSVRDLGRRRSHWVVRGPAGTQFEWDSVLTEQSRPDRLAWRSEPGAEIGQSGSVQFEPHQGGTRVTVRMSYNPPAGKLGHGIATLLGADPKRQMDDDLARMKSLLERGSLPHDMARGSKPASRFLH
jgi:uncharacterized membrane protein